MAFRILDARDEAEALETYQRIIHAPRYYRLDDQGEPVPIAAGREALRDWGAWLERSKTERRVAESVFGGAKVLTMFTGIDQSVEATGLVFETRIFGGRHDGYVEYAATRRDACVAFERAVKIVRSSLY